jgi:ribosomal-protein-alanine N-acetyltransferase
MMKRTYFLETTRIGFSIWQQEDIGLAQQLWGNAEVGRYISATGMFSAEESMARLQKEMRTQETRGMQYWPIFAREDNAFLGCAGLRPYGTEATAAEFGVHLLPAAWGKGYATEAGQAVMAYAFDVLAINALFAGHHPENKSSQKMLEKLGFVYEKEEFYPPTGRMHPLYRRQK